MFQEPDTTEVENQTTENENENDPVKFSFLIAGEPEQKLDLESTPSEEDLANKETLDAEEEWRNSRSIAAVPDREKQNEDTEKEPAETAEDSDSKESKPDSKERKKVKFKKKQPQFQQPQQEAQHTEAAPLNEEVPTAEEDPSQLTTAEQEFIDKLPEEAKKSINFWKDAESVDPKYKGYAKRQINYIKQLSQKVQELRDQDPDLPIAENPKYIAWVKNNKPSINKSEIERLKEEIIIKRAEERVSQKQESKLQEFENWKRQQEIEKTQGPIYQKQRAQISNELTDAISNLPEATEVMGLYRKTLAESNDSEKAIQAMREEYPEESAIIAQHYSQGKAMIDNLLAVRMGLVSKENINLKQGSLHKEIASRILAQEQAMITDPRLKGKLIKDGKKFATTKQLQAMSPAERQKHWTFSTDDLVSFFKQETVARTKKELLRHKKFIDRVLTKYGSKTKPQSGDDQTGNMDAPRHKGADSPSSSQRSPSKEKGSSVSKILDWDF